MFLQTRLLSKADIEELFESVFSFTSVLQQYLSSFLSEIIVGICHTRNWY